MTDSVKSSPFPRRGALLAASAAALLLVAPALSRDAQPRTKKLRNAGSVRFKPPAGDRTEVVAGIDTFAVTAAMVERRLAPFRRRMAHKSPLRSTNLEAEHQNARKSAVGEILLGHLLELETAKRGIRIPPARLDSAFSKILRFQFPDSTRRRLFLHDAPEEAQDLKLMALAHLEADTLVATIFADSLRISDQEFRTYHEADKANIQVPETLEEMRSARKKSLTIDYTRMLLRSAKVTFLNPQYEDPSQFPAW